MLIKISIEIDLINQHLCQNHKNMLNNLLSRQLNAMTETTQAIFGNQPKPLSVHTK